MHNYIAILRGINVGGKNRLPMSELKAVLERAGFEEIQTYIQSGNIVFKTEETSSVKLAKRLFTTIKNNWGFQVPVIVLTAQQLSDILSVNPFISEREAAFQHITFLDKEPEIQLIENMSGIKDVPNEYQVSTKAVYLYCPRGYSKTKLTNNFIEKKLKVTATTRNLKTSLILLEMAQ
jgi:uncharacterized protein (DUF1697 family)